MSADLSNNLIRSLGARPVTHAVLIAVCFLIFRVIALLLSDIDIGPDEGQYWWWSRELQAGYYSKPPMIAWLIGITTALFGNEEWAVRLASPVLIAGTSLVLFALARHIYGSRTGFWVLVIWNTLPIVMFAGGLISTDLPLLFFYSLALYGFIRIGTSAGRMVLVWAVVCGGGLGLGLLSKYAMIYFLLSIPLAALISPVARKSLKPVPMIMAGLVAGLILAPNILWNAANEFHTLSHTKDNADWARATFNFGSLLEFFGAQFVLMGPAFFAMLMWGGLRFKRRIKPDMFASEDQRLLQSGYDRLLLAFAAPPLVIICLQAFIARAHANWAMAAYPSAIILVTTWLLRGSHLKTLRFSVGGHLLFGVLLTMITIHLPLADALGLSDGFKRVRHWDEQARHIEIAAEDYPAILVDDRELMGNLVYYLRDSGKPIYAWDLNRIPDNHYEIFNPLPLGEYERVLMVMKYPEYQYAIVEFADIKMLGVTSVDTGVPCRREYTLLELTGYDATKSVADVVPPEKINARRADGCRAY